MLKVIWNIIGVVLFIGSFLGLIEIPEQCTKWKKLLSKIRDAMGLRGKLAPLLLALVGLLIIAVANSSSLQAFILKLMPTPTEEQQRQLRVDAILGKEHQALTKRLNEWIEDLEIRINAEGPIASSPTINPIYPNEKRRFESDYRPESKRLRDELLKRLGPSARDEVAMKCYEDELKLQTLMCIRNDLTRLGTMAGIIPFFRLN